MRYWVWVTVFVMFFGGVFCPREYAMWGVFAIVASIVISTREERRRQRGVLNR